MRKGLLALRVALATGLFAAANSGSGLMRHQIDLLNRSQEAPPIPRGSGVRRRADKASWKNNLRRANQKRGNSRPIARSR